MKKQEIKKLSKDEVVKNIDKLKKTGFCLTGNMEKEIDQTLSLCEVFTT